MQFQPMGKPALGIIFDSDAGNRPETGLAIALLQGFDAKNDVRAILFTTSKTSLKSAAFLDAFSRFYAAGGFVRALPVGMADGGRDRSDTPLMTAVLDRRNAEGKPAYPHQILGLNDTADVNAVLRNAMTAQHDGNCAVVCNGPATNLATLLSLAGAKEWIEHKVKYLVISDYLKSDVAAAKKVFAEWPGPIVLAGADASDGILFPASAAEKEFAWSQGLHPVLDAWKAAGAKDVPTMELSAVLYAARPQEGYFQVSDPGTISIQDDGSTKFTASAQGRHRRLLPAPGQKERILKTYVELASAKPVPRARFRPPVAEAKKPEEKKPEVKKPDAAPQP